MSSTAKADEPSEGTAGVGHDRAGSDFPGRGAPSRAAPQRTHTSIAGLATHYRLRCLALQATVDALEAQLERKNGELDEVVARYEELLAERSERESQDGDGEEGRDSPVFTFGWI